MKETYISASLDIIDFEEVDIICDSLCPDDDWYCPVETPPL